MYHRSGRLRRLVLWICTMDCLHFLASQSQLLPISQLRSPPLHPLLKIAAAISETVLKYPPTFQCFCGSDSLTWPRSIFNSTDMPTPSIHLPAHTKIPTILPPPLHTLNTLNKLINPLLQNTPHDPLIHPRAPIARHILNHPFPLNDFGVSIPLLKCF